MDKKIFHPTMEKSTVEEIDLDALEHCACILHDIGWPTQQGMFALSMERLRWYAELDEEAFLKACANGLTVIRGVLDALNSLK